jgi:hypothetical protein
VAPTVIATFGDLLCFLCANAFSRSSVIYEWQNHARSELPLAKCPCKHGWEPSRNSGRRRESNKQHSHISMCTSARQDPLPSFPLAWVSIYVRNTWRSSDSPPRASRFLLHVQSKWSRERSANRLSTVEHFSTLISSATGRRRQGGSPARFSLVNSVGVRHLGAWPNSTADPPAFLLTRLKPHEGPVPERT